MSRCEACAPRRTNTGRPETDIATVPSPTRAPLRGRVVTMSALAPPPCLISDVASTTGWGEPYRTVPRTITSLESTRSSTGTVIAEGSGAAVSAATWAGERICAPATHAPTESSSAATSPTATVRLLRAAFIYWYRPSR